MSEPSTSESATAASNAKPPIKWARWWVIAICVLVVLVVGGGTQAVKWRMLSWQPSAEVPDRPWNNAPYFTTPPDVADKMLQMADVKESDLVYDLGCGDGRIGIAAAAKYGCRVKGFDIEPERIRESRANALDRGVEELCEFEERDIFTLDLSEVDVVVMYLLPRYGKRLIPQFEQMRPGSRIVSYDFDIEGIPPDKTVSVRTEDGLEHWVHLWVTPLRKRGRIENEKWRMKNAK